jgi:2-methylisocitrate lyase-like PEP mutase family enzyme
VLVNVWDAVSARAVASAPGVKAIASASHAVSYAHGVDDGEGLGLDQALEAARIIVGAVDLPVTIDFERGYATDAATLAANVTRLIDTGAAGLNLEDSTGDQTSPLVPLDLAVERVAAVRAAADAAGVPLVLNARADSLVRGGTWQEFIERANAYLAAGADVIFGLGLTTEEHVARAIAEIDGRVSVIAGPTSVPLPRLAELGVCRVSFGPGPLGLALAHLQAAATRLTALGDYPAELGFAY